MRLEQAELCEATRHDDLLLHYVNGAQRTVESVDQLGNFLMGFGVLALGYLLNADLSVATAALGVGAAGHQVSALLALGAWGVSVGLLVAFVLTYVFRVIAGRAVHPSEGNDDAIGEVIQPPDDMTFQQFVRPQRTFAEFLEHSYLPKDRRSAEALLYARWTYMRFMTLKKLAAMERMRGLLGMAVVAGVTFKVVMIYQAAIG